MDCDIVILFVSTKQTVGCLFILIIKENVEVPDIFTKFLSNDVMTRSRW